jgi:hypothetical protein
MPPIAISQRIRESGLSDVASDIPPGVTLAEYGAARSRGTGRRLRVLVARLLSGRGSR